MTKKLGITAAAVLTAILGVVAAVSVTGSDTKRAVAATFVPPHDTQFGFAGCSQNAVRSTTVGTRFFVFNAGTYKIKMVASPDPEQIPLETWWLTTGMGAVFAWHIAGTYHLAAWRPFCGGGATTTHDKLTITVK